MSIDNAFDVAKPINKTLIADVPPWIRNVKVQVKALLEKEHRTLGAGGSGAEHVLGSARAYLQSLQPTARPDGVSNITTAPSTALAMDNGRLAVLTGISSDHNVLSVYVATSAGVSTGWESIHVASAGKAYSADVEGEDDVILDNNKAIKWRTHEQPSTTINGILVNSTGEVSIPQALVVGGVVEVGGKITNVTDPEDDQDAVTKLFLDTRVGETDIVPNEVGAATNSITLPNGLIMKWGYEAGAASWAIRTVTFPVEFPNKCFYAKAAGTYILGAVDRNVYVAAQPIVGDEATMKTGFRSYGYDDFRWFAIGY